MLRGRADQSFTRHPQCPCDRHQPFQVFTSGGGYEVVLPNGTARKISSPPRSTGSASASNCVWTLNRLHWMG
jgi:hypothetical protein